MALPHERRLRAAPSWDVIVALDRQRHVGVALLLLAVVMAPHPTLKASVQDAPSGAEACQGVTGSVDQISATLSTVPRYGSTYVLVLSPGVGADVTSLDAPALKTVEIAVQAGPAGAAIVQAKGLKSRSYPLDGENLTKPIADLLAGRANAAVLWAPLAALGIDRLDPAGTLRMLNVGGPEPPPAPFSASSPGAPDPCAMNLAGLIEANGVVPAELFVPADIRRLIGRPPPVRDPEEARQGAALYANQCARCHGPHALAQTGALAPVDLLRSVRRFQYAGFEYIVLNGRAKNGMPPLRGTLSERQIASIYQYVRARSRGDLGPDQ
jgi:mono/diheme cytochrome c family protein